MGIRVLIAAFLASGILPFESFVHVVILVADCGLLETVKLCDSVPFETKLLVSCAFGVEFSSRH